jgi:hypothetical protein
VGGVGLRQIAEGMIKGDFSDAEGAESVSLSHGELGLVVEALDDAAGELFLGMKIIEDQLAVATPPVGAFWSVTLYDSEDFQVANSLNRFAVSSWMPFKYNSDGSLDIYFQSESPGKDNEANWLPTPKGSLQSDHAPLFTEI